MQSFEAIHHASPDDIRRDSWAWLSGETVLNDAVWVLGTPVGPCAEMVIVYRRP